MRISDWSSDVCSSDLFVAVGRPDRSAAHRHAKLGEAVLRLVAIARHPAFALHASQKGQPHQIAGQIIGPVMIGAGAILRLATVFPAQQRTAMGAAILDDVDFAPGRSDEHTSDLQSLMRTSYAVFCMNKKQISQ